MNHHQDFLYLKNRIIIIEKDYLILKQLNQKFPNKAIISSIMGRNEEEWNMFHDK